MIRRRARGWFVLLWIAGALSSLSFASVTQATAPTPVTRIDESSPLPRKQVLRRALRAEPSQGYLIYVPGKAGRGAPILVDVHGISRNAEQHATLFAPYAEKYGVVLVSPCFTKENHPGYQWLSERGPARRADLALDAIVEEVERLTGASTDRIYLFGFSGGAQFAHRYVLAHPDRIAGAVVAAAGWYTFPDSTTPYPYGLGVSEEHPDVHFEAEKFLRVPIAVFVGDEDVGNESLRQNPQVDRQQGTTRRERAHNWVAAMKRAAVARGLAPRVTYEEVAGIHHSFEQFMREGGLGDRVFRTLFGSPGSVKPRSTQFVPTEHQGASH